MAPRKTRQNARSAAAPVYYTVPQLAELTGMPGWKLRRWLKKANVLEKKGGAPVTTAERLAAEFPEIYRRLIEQ